MAFAVPAEEFGGYWGCASTTTPMVFTFSDPQGALIGSESVLYSQTDASPSQCSFEIRDQADGGGNQIFNATYPTTHSVSSAVCP